MATTTTLLFPAPFLLLITISLSSLVAPSLSSSASILRRRGGSSPISLPLVHRSSIFKPGDDYYAPISLPPRPRRRSAGRFLPHSEPTCWSTGTALSSTSPSKSSAIAPVISGYPEDHMPEYYVQASIGTPPRDFWFILDTALDVSWLQCLPCISCYNQSVPVFDPAASSSFAELSCGAPKCDDVYLSKCRSEKCCFSHDYGTLFSYGNYVTETLSFGSDFASLVALGCGHYNGNVKRPGPAGCLALGASQSSLASQLNLQSFSYCLVYRNTRDGSSFELNSTFPTDAAATAALSTSDHLYDSSYYIGVSGISVAGQLLPVPASAFEITRDGDGGVALDSVFTNTYLRLDIYLKLRDAFVKAAQLGQWEEIGDYDVCRNMTGIATLPSVAFHFTTGGVWNLTTTQNYMVELDGEHQGMFCLAFRSSEDTISTIGSIMQQGTRVSIDLVENKVGFSPSEC